MELAKFVRIVDQANLDRDWAHDPDDAPGEHRRSDQANQNQSHG
jgi:hypothetical protein